LKPNAITLFLLEIFPNFEGDPPKNCKSEDCAFYENYASIIFCSSSSFYLGIKDWTFIKWLSICFADYSDILAMILSLISSLAAILRSLLFIFMPSFYMHFVAAKLVVSIWKY